MSKDREKEIGRRLLESSTGVGMDEILSQIRQLHAYQQSGPTFNIPAVDQLLNESRRTRFKIDDEDLHPDDTDVSLEHLISRQKNTTRATLIELTSSHPKAGENILLTHLIANVLLPEEFDDRETHGKESVVVFIDAQEKFDLVLLWDMMHEILVAGVKEQTSSQLSVTTDESITTALHKAMERLYLLRSSSLQSLLETLINLPTALHSNTRLAKFPVGLIAINSTTECFIANRLEQLSVSEPSALLDALIGFSSPSLSTSQVCSPVPTQPDEPLEATTSPTPNRKQVTFHVIIQHLRSLSVRFECPVICTTLNPQVFSQNIRTGRVNRHGGRDKQPQRWQEVPPVDQSPTLNPMFPILPTIQIVVSQKKGSFESGRAQGMDDVGGGESMEHNAEKRFRATVTSNGPVVKKDFEFLFKEKRCLEIMD